MGNKWYVIYFFNTLIRKNTIIHVLNIIIKLSSDVRNLHWIQNSIYIFRIICSFKKKKINKLIFTCNETRIKNELILLILI